MVRAACRLEIYGVRVSGEVVELRALEGRERGRRRAVGRRTRQLVEVVLGPVDLLVEWTSHWIGRTDCRGLSWVNLRPQCLGCASEGSERRGMVVVIRMLEDWVQPRSWARGILE